MTWIDATKQHPCPICHKPDWCGVSDDGKLCHCHRVPSSQPTSNGWIHHLIESQSGEALIPHFTPKPAPPVEPEVDVAAYFAALPRGNEQVRLCRYLSRELGLCADSLQTLDARWDRQAKAVAFPMYDADERVVGIRYRQLKTGKKWALKGSHDGLFFSGVFLTINPRDLVICEGPTDTAAAIACGLSAVGRSSCGTGLNLLRDLIRRFHTQRVTIAADADEPKKRSDGSTWKPGLDGAKRLADEIGVATRIVFPPPRFKDLRDWYSKGGMTGTDFNIAAASAKWITPKGDK